MGSFLIVRVGAVAGCLLTFALGAPLAASGLGAPEPVSPASGAGEALVEARCPTFSFAGLEGARGYELVVLAVPEGAEGVGEEPPVVATATLSPGARAWTPSLGSCLERGGRYAWSVRAVTPSGEGPWSEPALFRVAAGPSAQEVEAAIETLRHYLEDSQADIALPRAAQQLRDRLAEPAEPQAASTAECGALSPELPSLRPLEPAVTHALDSPDLVLADAPVLGSPSLSVSANIALGAASNLFKDGAVFLWDDTSGNIALGREALVSATGNATNNTAFGREALRDTVGAALTFYGSGNTAVGDQALRSNTTGFGNTASGDRALLSNITGRLNTASGSRALLSNTTGSFNTASGEGALFSNTTGPFNTASGSLALYSNTIGNRNTASGNLALLFNTVGSRNTGIGHSAGQNLGFEVTTPTTSMSDNIYIGSGALGVADEANTIRIGGSTGTLEGQQNRTFIAGIRGITTGDGDTVPVVIDINGQLGTASSSRETKQDLREVGELSRRLLDLRPVAFRYKVHAGADPETPLQFGLIAEEVAEVFPELVVLDGDGRPETVKYHLLAALLVNELQRAERGLIQAERELEQQRTELLALRDRMTAVEQGRPPERSAVPWWRRQGGGGRDAP